MVCKVHNKMYFKSEEGCDIGEGYVSVGTRMRRLQITCSRLAETELGNTERRDASDSRRLYGRSCASGSSRVG